jgi:hypothetical protein
MPLQNRVDPFGELHAAPDRGLFMGNRGGCFHREEQTLKHRHWTRKRRIICVLIFKDRERALMQPGLYTELFFLDEATALAAGHRPCFDCRRAEASAFRDGLITIGHLQVDETIDKPDAIAAGEIQPVLSGARPREAVTPSSLPGGAMYATGGGACLKHDGAARAWSFKVYGARQPLHASGERPTPHITCEALRAGYRPLLHPSVNA